MIIIHKDSHITIKWHIYKGASTVTEDFSRTDLRVLLYGKGAKRRYPAEYELTDEHVKVTVPDNLPIDAYDLMGFWEKNESRHEHCEPHFHGGDIQRSNVKDVFAITDVREEVTNPDMLDVTLKVKSSVATYGFDGLDAYELYILKKGVLPEEEFLTNFAEKEAQLNETIRKAEEMLFETNGIKVELESLESKVAQETKNLDDKISEERNRAESAEAGKTLKEVGIVRTESTLVLQVKQKDGGTGAGSIPPATTITAGIMTSADKLALKDLQDRLPRVEGIKIVEVTPTSGRELKKWQLIDSKGVALGAEIVTYNDRFIKSIDFETVNNRQYLKITYIDETGTERVTRTDIGEAIIQAQYGNGLVVSGNEVSVKLANDTETIAHLCFSGDGSLRIFGIKTLEDKVAELSKVIGKKEYLTQDAYDLLVTQHKIDPECEYNIFEE